MTSLVAIFVGLLGLLGMAGLWVLAWRLWKQALAFEPTPSPSESGIGASNWRNEPTPSYKAAQAAPSDPHPGWSPAGSECPASVEPEPIEEAPVVRAHLSSSANTSFFSRADLDALRANVDKTEILNEDEIFEEPPIHASSSRAEPTQPGLTRKTKFFRGPPPPLVR